MQGHRETSRSCFLKAKYACCFYEEVSFISAEILY